MYRIFRTLHAWGGITLALLMLLSSVTGTLLVWKHEYVRFTIPAAHTAFDPTPESLATIAAAVEAQFDNNEIALIQFATARFPLTRVNLVDANYAYVSPQGEVVARWVQNERPEEWLYDLHHRLLLENFGLTLLGLAALAMMLLVLAGLIAFWPMRRGWRLGLVPRAGSRGALLASHRNLGVALALPFLVTLATGVLLAFPQQSEELLLEPFRGEDYSMDFGDDLDDISGGDSGDWLPAMQRALATFPGSQIRTAQAPSVFSGYRVIGVQQPGELHPLGMSRVYVDFRDGWMDLRIDSRAQHVSERIYNLALPLHTGRFDSTLYKLLLTLLGVLVATLSTLGILAFLRRFARGTARAQQAQAPAR